MRSITLFALFCARLAEADMRLEWTVLYGHEEFRKTDTMLQDYLRKAHSSAEADREKVIASVRTPVALQKYQSETAARLRAILGEFPARTPLNPKVAGRLERSGYTVEKLIFERRPHYYVTANVYVPRGRTGPFPGGFLASWKDIRYRGRTYGFARGPRDSCVGYSESVSGAGYDACALMPPDGPTIVRRERLWTRQDAR